MSVPAAGIASPPTSYGPSAASRPVVSRATADDDAGIRALLRAGVIPGTVSVAMTREPTYAAGEGLAGAHDVTVVARHAGAVTGVGHVTIRPLHVGGTIAPVAYLGELRLDPAAPGAPHVLRDGFARLAEAVREAGCATTFTSIATDNVRARRVLAHGGRFGLPRYAPLADLVTMLVPVPRRARAAPHDTTPSDDDVDEGTRFLDASARRHDLALPFDAGTWVALARHGAGAARLHVVRDTARIVGATALWDQRAFRQLRVMALSGPLAAVRPVMDATLALRGLPALPRPGAVLAQGALLGATVDTPARWPALLSALAPAARAVGLDWLLVARDARDPELAVLRRLRGAREYRTTLHTVRWRRDVAAPERRPDRLVRPEVALL
jgi:hypothetical protein